MEITAETQQHFTVHRAIHKCRLELYHTELKKLYVNEMQKHRRLLWIKAHLKLTEAKWKTVVR